MRPSHSTAVSRYPWGIALTLGERAHAARMQGDQTLAARLFAESIAVAEEIGVARIIMGAVAGLAGVALALGQPERAVRLLGAVEAARETSGVGRIAHAARTPSASPPRRGPACASRCSPPPGTRGGTSRCRAACRRPSPSPHPPGSSHHPCTATSAICGLTPRELDVLRLLVEGHSDREIGEALFIGTRTVQTHVANLFAKLGVNARAEAAAVAVRRGLV